jgi:hypothetical protein
MFTIRVSRSFGGRRRFLAPTWNGKTQTWSLQWANPSEHGHHYEPPIERGFPTKAAAERRKRELLAGGAS